MAAVITEQARNGRGSELSTGKPVAIQAHLRAALPVLAAALVLGIFYLGIYVVRHYSLPIGWDTPRYLFHANFAAARGLGGIPGSLPPPSPPSRWPSLRERSCRTRFATVPLAWRSWRWSSASPRS